jgi:hypothetical protein
MSMNPHEAAAMIVDLADKKWTSHEQAEFLSDLLASNVFAVRLDENTDLRHEPSYEDGYKAGYSNGEDARNEEHSKTIADLEKQIDDLKGRNEEIEKINAALDVKLAELEREKP